MGPGLDMRTRVMGDDQNLPCCQMGCRPRLVMQPECILGKRRLPWEMGSSELECCRFSAKHSFPCRNLNNLNVF